MIKPTPPSGPEKALNEQKSKLKKHFPFLTDEDLKYDINKKDLMMNHLQITLGKTKSELETLLATL
ncbi:MAG: general stress protein CsbD [Bacteroidota bacterium]|nr:general stress protein CsbD [Bacteroidota bacterium]